MSQVKASAGTQFTYFDHAQPWADLYDPDYMPGGDVDAACILLKQGCEETSTWTDHTRIDATRAYYYKTIKVSSLDESLQQQVAPLDCLVRCCEAAAGWVGRTASKPGCHLTPTTQTPGRERIRVAWQCVAVVCKRVRDAAL